MTDNNSKSNRLAVPSCNENLAATPIDKNKRRLLVWSAPVVAAISLPAHAQTSCTATAPELVVVSFPKCSGSPPLGQAVLELRIGGADDLIITNIDFTTDDIGTTLTGIPIFPATITSTAPISLTWMGPASDAISCAPTSQSSMTVSFACSETSPVQTVDFDVDAILLASIP